MMGDNSEGGVKYECRYFDSASKTWRANGITTFVIDDELTCITDHLSDFAGFLIINTDNSKDYYDNINNYGDYE